METTFYSNGKLLLTGEYVVLDGATALATPTRYGQNLQLKENKNPTILWKSYTHEKTVWFSDEFRLKDLVSLNNKENPISKTLTQILREARNLNSNFLSNNKGYRASTNLNFPRDWGLGTSSTLINNIAQWAAVDAFKLLNNSFGGSGYDIAAAQNNTPIFYQKTNNEPKIKSTSLDWNFLDALFFVHLNQKQDSKQGIAHYRKNVVDEKVIQRISEISCQLPKCKSLSEFETLIKVHEQIISNTISLPTIKEKLFKDYSGTVKSLGAWGGDFILATGDDAAQAYFRQKGFKTIIPFKKMIRPTGSFRTS